MPFIDKLHQVKIEPGEPGYSTGEEYRCTKPMRYRWARRGHKIFILMPGAINNGASIPTVIPDIILSDHGKIDKPAAVHDDIYWAYREATANERKLWEEVHGRWTKADADLQFYDGCRDEAVPWWSCALLYTGVKANLIARLKWGKNV